LGWSTRAHAYASAEVLTADAYQYGRFEASIRFVSGSGVIGSFFLWKSGSEVEGTFWNELDFETLGSDCRLETNAFYGNPAQVHVEQEGGAAVCGAFHTYSYEWTPDYVAWLVDGEEVRRETGETAAAFRENATEGMQIHFNLWPGDASFGGTFDPSLLPVYQNIDWVQYSSYDGTGFVLEWREEFDDGFPSGWELGDWESPKGLSTHSLLNVGVSDGALVLALTADDAQGIPGLMPVTGAGGVGGTTGTGDTSATGGVVSTGAGGSGGSSLTGTGTDSGGTSNAGGATAAVGTETTAVSSQGSTTMGSVTSTTGGIAASSTSITSTATSSSVASTAAATTGGGAAATEAATVLGGTNGSSTANSSDDGAGCGCRTAGYRQTRGVPTPLGGFLLVTLAASLQIRRRSKRQVGPRSPSQRLDVDLLQTRGSR